MRRRVLLILMLAASLTVPASAQLVVIDPANLVQTVLIAQRAQQVYEQLQNEYLLIQRMAQRLDDLTAYRIPPIAITRHDSGRWEFGRRRHRKRSGSDKWSRPRARAPPNT